MTTRRIEKVPAEALKFHFGDDTSVCEFAEADEDGKVPVKIKARSRGPISHWYWGQVIHDMAGMKLSKKRIPIDYCHRHDEVLGALDSFDTESGDLLTEGFMDPEDPRAAEVIRKGKMGIPYEASIFFDPRTIEAERLSDRESATVNGVTVRGPVTIIRKWTLRGVAACPYGYDPKTSTRFSENEGDVEVTLFTNEPEEEVLTMPVEQTSESTEQLTDQAGTETSQETQTETSTELSQQAEGSSETDADEADDGGELSEEEAEEPAEAETELADESEPTAEPKSAPGQAFIDRFGLEKGSVYFARGLSMEEAMGEHVASVEKENTSLKEKIKAASLGSDEALSFSGEGAAAAGKSEKKDTGDTALDAFCANTRLPGRS